MLEKIREEIEQDKANSENEEAKIETVLIVRGKEMPKSCDDCSFQGPAHYCMLTLTPHNTHAQNNSFDSETERSPLCPLQEATGYIKHQETTVYCKEGNIRKQEKVMNDQGKILLVQAVLNRIRNEMDRLYFNKYQKEMNSPFDNTGESYETSVFSVRAYSWSDDEEEQRKPNFQYGDFTAEWYKHSGRGTCVTSKAEITADFLAKMLEDCFEAMRKDFGEEND